MPVPTTFVTLPVQEPSGVAYHPQRGTLIVVSDQGQIVEMDLHLKVLQRLDVRGDLEGVSVHPATGTLFIASKANNAVIEYDIDRHQILRTLVVNFKSHPDFAEGLTRNGGLEGVAVVTTSTGEYRLFAVVEADPARLVSLSEDVSARATEQAPNAAGADPLAGLTETVDVLTSHDLGLTRISDIMFDVESRSLLVISAGERVLRLSGLDGRVFRSIRLPGKKPEGICLVPNGDAVVVQDTGGLWICRNLHSSLFPRR
ncbi:MAG: SdiA-regulated domain-containing protein [Phycisphaerae bacterium]